MNDYIAYCGLDCEKCDAFIATKNDDNELRNKVSKEWTELNGVDITPEMINCEGCRIDGVKTPFCNELCPIRNCSMERKNTTCGDCSEMGSCEKIQMIHGSNQEAKDNLICK